MSEKVTMVFDNNRTFIGIIESKEELEMFKAQRPKVPYEFIREKKKVVQKLVVELGYNYDESLSYFVEDGDLVIFRDDELNMYEMIDYHIRDLHASIETIQQFVDALELKDSEIPIVEGYMQELQNTFVRYLDTPAIDEDLEGFIDMEEYAKIALKPWGVDY